MKTRIISDEKEIANLHVEKEDNTLASLFQEESLVPAKEDKTAELVADQSMVEQMGQMGYGTNLIKKALLAVKNQSVPSALDMIEKMVAEEKKKKTEKRSTWNCPVCTFLNRADLDTCEMCGELYQFVDQAEKQKLKLEKQAEEEQKKKIEEEKVKIEEAAEIERMRRVQEQVERLRKIEEK